MKLLFFLLVLLNVSYLAWNLVFDEETVVAQEPELPAGVVRLTLVTEREYWETQADLKTVGLKDSATQDKGSEKESSVTCYTIGPYKNESNAENIRNLIQSEDFEASRRMVSEKIPDSIWVYLPAMESRIAALRLTESLDDKGVKDYYVVPSPPNRNAISLGLYKRPERARQRASEIEALGFSPELETRHEEIQRYWIDYQEDADHVLSEAVWNVPLKDEAVQREKRPCK